MKLRDYQQEIFDLIISATTNDLIQLDTGAGKTPIEAALCGWAEHSIIVAHRNILISQCSEKLAAFSIMHDTISTEHTRRRCMLAHKKHGKNFISRGNKKTLVASIDSLISRYKRGKLDLDTNLSWLIVIDEAHHIVPDNKWGDLLDIFHNSRVIGFTATPGRMDGQSLSRKKGGVFDKLVQCEYLKEKSVSKLINKNILSGFKFYSPEFYEKSHRHRIRSDTLLIANDPIKIYKKFMNNRRTIMMCATIKNAEEHTELFRNAGISAGCISSNMSAVNVSRIIDLFSAGKIKVLCNVDMVGEGFDLPAVDGLIMARQTKSFIMYRQWIGRALRTSPGKDIAIIVDLVGNANDHGYPDDNIIWDIDNPPRTPSAIKNAPCRCCGFWYPIIDMYCPDCGEENILHNRRQSITPYKEIYNLDIELIEASRKEADRRYLQKKKEMEISESNNYLISYGHAGKIAEGIRRNFIDVIHKSGIEIIKINEFIEKDRNINFWFSNFTAKDADNLSPKKALRIFKEWQKSN
ncbi:DEAD/DEAH box helicase [Photorhabdus luminescens]|uniref:DEAD/DEAH box helicase n=1 Tax=Photorhabdus luminescens subsp. mexicana TaxID=2100167 RepID=A0A4R4JHD4_PHOLU|nr:DEAD/DEAH box helicase [Photorhabdus luminescens]TDB53042.1 hypothetical protein C5468_08930 [Photorhabdus luminescens subsp. mexicana]